MVMEIIGIPAVFDGSQLLADYHWHFRAYSMILSVYAIGDFLNFEKKLARTHAHTHTRARTRTRAGDNLQYFNWFKYFKMCTWFYKMYVVPCISNHYIRIKMYVVPYISNHYIRIKMYVVPCISNHYIRIKIQEIFWNAWPQKTILFQQGLFWLNPLVK